MQSFEAFLTCGNIYCFLSFQLSTYKHHCPVNSLFYLLNIWLVGTQGFQWVNACNFVHNIGILLYTTTIWCYCFVLGILRCCLIPLLCHSTVVLCSMNSEISVRGIAYGFYPVIQCEKCVRISYLTLTTYLSTDHRA